MRKLQIEQYFENIQTTYDQPSITWSQESAMFSLNEDDPATGQLIVWQDGVAPEQILTELDGLERKINQFSLAMQVTDNARMRKKDEPKIKYYAKEGREFEISKGYPQIVDIILKHERGEPYFDLLGGGFKTELECLITSSLVELPSTLPQASIEYQRLIGIFTSAEDFSGPYLVEHQLRNYFLIMEELIKIWHKAKPDFYCDLEEIRNFVSHAKCSHEHTKEFIQEKFPDAIIKKNNVEYAQFDRTKDSHINFIWTYRDKAYFWVKEQLAQISKLENGS